MRMTKGMNHLWIVRLVKIVGPFPVETFQGCDAADAGIKSIICRGLTKTSERSHSEPAAQIIISLLLRCPKHPRPITSSPRMKGRGSVETGQSKEGHFGV